MARLTVIEDCSPYYIRFTHDGIDELISYCQNLLTDELVEKAFSKPARRLGNLEKLDDDGFRNYKLPEEQAKKVLSLTPLSEKMPFMEERVSFFITKPGHYYRAHKDGLDHRVSINYTIKISDDKCITSWYDEEELKRYSMDFLPSNSSRECAGFIRENHTPLKSMTAKPNEIILFNSEIFHDWDNSNSENLRCVLTLRHKHPSPFYFDDAKKLFFGI
jgi:hypothetical protein